MLENVDYEQDEPVNAGEQGNEKYHNPADGKSSHRYIHDCA